VSSVAVIDELRKGQYPTKAACLDLMKDIQLVNMSNDIADIVEYYIQHKLMPSNPLGDALHLAVASFHKCDILLTWNCKHLANANKFGHIRRINAALGLYVPTLSTPLELLPEPL
jgi:hypothetical protein